MKRLITAFITGISLLSMMTTPIHAASHTQYHQLLAQAKADPKAADFTALRLAFARTDLYDPYRFIQGTRDMEKFLQDSLKAQDWERTLRYLNTLLELNYVRINLHLTAALSTKNSETRRGLNTTLPSRRGSWIPYSAPAMAGRSRPRLS